MITTQIEQSALTDLQGSIQGSVLTSDDENYEAARAVWNGVIDKYPRLIVRCAGTADVITAVDFARSHDVLLSVKAGGHMTTGHAVCDDGIVIDLSQMDAIRVDPKNKTVRVQGGATWDQVDHETLPFGLIPPGVPADIGVGGFTLGGGMGIITRKYGLAVDNLREVDIVTADGKLVTASADEQEDLFWALRGGGGNFGVVTSFLFDCVEESTECLIGQALYPIDAAADYLRYFRDAISNIPDELYPIASFISIPPLEGIPEELHGKPALSVYVISLGKPADVSDSLDTFLDFGDPIIQITNRVPYTALFDPFKVPKGERHHWECAYLREISDELIDTAVENVLPLPTPGTAVNFYGLGGAESRIDPDTTAYAHRDSKYLCHITTHWLDPADDDANTAWTRKLHQVVSAYGTGGEYINNQTDDNRERIRAAFGTHYDRLAEIKARWDPDNIFRNNHNILPLE